MLGFSAPVSKKHSMAVWREECLCVVWAGLPRQHFKLSWFHVLGLAHVSLSLWICVCVGCTHLPFFNLISFIFFLCWKLLLLSRHGLPYGGRVEEMVLYLSIKGVCLRMCEMISKETKKPHLCATGKPVHAILQQFSCPTSLLSNRRSTFELETTYQSGVAHRVRMAHSTLSWIFSLVSLWWGE